tara:strand:+ start:90 stop:314 length:225 start_codon:yes stop_codon:yes gene_type:complete
MSLLEKLTSGKSQLTSFAGTTPVTPNFQQSTLHRDYSTVGIPVSGDVKPRNGKLPMPSELDPNTINQYILNLPK